MRAYCSVGILAITTFSTAIFQISSILQHVEETTIVVEPSREQFQYRRGRALASSFTSLEEEQLEDDDANKYEVGRQQPRKLDLNYLLAMMEQPASASNNGHLIQPTTRLQQMAADAANKVKPSLPQDVEDRMRQKQDLYLGLLRKRGQLITDSDTGVSKLVSYSQLLLRMPRGLKGKKFSIWTKGEKVWANITHFPWSLDPPPCNSFSIQFGVNLPIVALASYPSSGNTWLRYLIEGATGFFTGSMYDDVAISHKGFYGEGVPYDSGMTIAIKSHGYTTEAFSKKALNSSEESRWAHNHIVELNKTAILLVRNPFRAIIGHRHLDEAGHTGHAKTSMFQGEGWDKYITNKIKSWELFYTDWCNSGSKLMLVHFENLVDNLDWNLLRILEFLGYEVDPRRLECLHRNQEGHFHRRIKASLIDDPFTTEQKDRIRGAIQRLDSVLKSRGFESLPLHKYEFY